MVTHIAEWDIKSVVVVINDDGQQSCLGIANASERVACAAERCSVDGGRGRVAGPNAMVKEAVGGL